MAAWTTIPDSDLDPESPITTSLMVALRDNPIAIAEGASGAPPAVLANSISQSKLKTAQGDVSTAGTGTLVTLPGGEYGFYPRIKMGAAVGTTWIANTRAVHAANGGMIGTTTGHTSYITEMVIGEDGGTTIFAQHRYLQASPPYDLGDGEIPLFIFLVALPDGTIESGYVAPDPPWGNNGPTDIRPDFYRDGIGYQRRIQYSVLPDDPALMPAWLEAARTASLIERPVDQALKQADMEIIPHPFIGNDLTGKTVVLLDPTGDICNDLCLLHNQPVEVDEDGKRKQKGVSDLLYDGYFKIGNSPLDVKAPPGVMPVSLKWKNTR